MALTLYMDQHVPKSITIGLRLRGVDVLTAYEDGRSALADPDLLDRASALQRVLFTQDDDLIAEAGQAAGRKHLLPRRHLRASIASPYRHLHPRS